MARCSAEKKGGTPCRAESRAGSKFCFFHDPASVKNRREAQSRGGSNGSRLEVMPPPPFDIDLEDPRKIPKLLTYIANGILRGEIETNVAYTFVSLVNCAIRAHNVVALDGRIKEIERLQDIEFPDPVGAHRARVTRFEDDEPIVS